MGKRLRVLLSAFYCSPYRGSESAVGWNIAVQLARYHDVTVLFGDLSPDVPFHADWMRWCRENPQGINGLEMVHVYPDDVIARIHRLHAIKGLWFLFYLAYRRWQTLAFAKAQLLNKERKFDIVHHLTIIGYREPGELWKLGVPFFWGPINGAVMTPWRYFSEFGLAGIYRHVSRNIMNGLQMRIPSRARRAAARASKIWAVTTDDRKMVESIWRRDAELMIETGSTVNPHARVRKLEQQHYFMIMWCGIIEDRKGLPLLLEALEGIDISIKFVLDIVGDGPERHRCRQLSQRLGLEDKVVWSGRIPHHQVQAKLAKSHILVHTAIKEGTPHVVLEALASGLPVICHDACGMGTVVDQSCGVKVPLRKPSASVTYFREAIIEIANNPDRLSALSSGAIKRAEELSWERIGERIGEAYLRESGVPKLPLKH